MTFQDTLSDRLPDVPEPDWRQYQSDQFSQDAQRRVDGFGFESAANSQIATLAPPVPVTTAQARAADLGYTSTPPDTLPPDIAPPPPEPVPAPPPETLPPPPPPEAAPALSPSPPAELSPPNAPVTAPPRYTPPTPTSSPAPSPPTASSMSAPSSWLADTFGAGLNAVQQAGGDAQAFASDFGSHLNQVGADAGDVVSGALTAAQNAGADVGQFASSFQLPSLPAPPPFTPSLSPPGQAVARGGDLQAYARQAAQNAGVDPDLFVRQIQQESGFSPTAKSPAGAIGIAQFMPDTARGVGVDPTDPYAALDAAARLDRQNLDRYQGDYRKALAAYNAGNDAVDKYGGVPPYRETQSYVSTILGGSQPKFAPVTTAQARAADLGYSPVSQFGDSSLSTDEAYAACGPAAAVRFAQVYGRNPTLREATDLAKSVGWTSATGMAGIGSEKALMDKLGVPTRLVGPDVQAIAQEASTGNPVTISTPGHYFTADGYDPNSGAFHVGQSGLDLKGGSEWMTPQQMSRLMGPIQGALFADNPQVPAPSTADQTSNPGSYLDRARQSIGGFFSGLGSTAQNAVSAVSDFGDQQVQHLNQAVRQSNLEPAVPTEASQPTYPTSYPGLSPSAPVTAPLVAPSAPPPSTPDQGGALQQALGAAGAALPDITDRLNAPPADTPLGRVVAGEPISSLSPTEQAQALYQWNVGYEQARQQAIENVNPARDVPVVGGLINSITDPEQLALIAAAGPLGEAAGGFAGAGTRGAITNWATQGALGNALITAAQGGSPEDIAQSAVVGAALGGGLRGVGAATGPVLSRALEALDVYRPPEDVYASTGAPPTPSGGPPSRAWDPAASADAANRAVGRILTEQTAPERPQGTPLQRLVRATTNRFEAADRYQQDALRTAGYTDLSNPPSDLDLSSLLRMQHGDAAAEIRLQRDLRPALRSAGDEQPALNTYLIHQNNIDVATAIGDQVEADALAKGASPAAARIAGQDARNTRAFSGGLRVADSERALQAMQSEMDPARYAQVEQAAQRVYDYLNGLRQTLVDSGVIDQATANDWQAKYPHWVPTRILDYMSEGGQSGQLRPGTKISLADSGVRNYTVEGTSKFRENPLASIVDLTHSVETRARRNRVANAFVDLDRAQPTAQQRLVATDRPALGNEPIVQRLNNGTVERYLAPPELATAINGPTIHLAPNFVRGWTNFVRNVTTIMSPAFALVRNPSLDTPEFYQRELARVGGNPLMLGRLTAALGRGFGDAFQGLLQGEYRGPLTQRYLLGGGGGSGMVERSLADRARTVRNLAAPTLEFHGIVPTRESLRQVGGYVINNVSDLRSVARQLATLQPLRAAGRTVQAVAERTELGPRLASMYLAEQRGATPARAVMNGRTVTIDFNEGGTLAKTINSFVPFFNAGVQGSAQVARALRENPRGFLASTGINVGLPAIAAEVWNNSDPQRAQDYADVPQYLKDQGVVIMLPGEAPLDAQGNRHPQYWWVNMRGYAPFSTAARTAIHQLLESTVGTPTPTDWQRAGQSLLFGASPIRASSVSDVPGALTPQFVPGATTGLQVAMNKDIFRNADIVTARNDQNASTLSKELAGGLTTAARAINPSWQVHPAAVEFAVRDMLGGVGSSLLGAREMLPGAEPRPGQVNQPQALPVVGGALTALGVRGTGGELGTEAREPLALLGPETRRYLQSQGIDWAPSPVTPSIGKVPLTQAEETRYQQLANRYVDESLRITRAQGELEGLSAQQKLDLIQRQVELARKRAANDIAATIPDAEWNRRIDAAQAAG